jgi:CRISPR-associated exonuclease Cas4
MCLEEMLTCPPIAQACLYYGQTAHRETVPLTEELRRQVRSTLEGMHALYARGYTPVVRRHKGCANCSLKDVCLPTLAQAEPVSAYIARAMQEVPHAGAE